MSGIIISIVVSLLCIFIGYFYFKQKPSTLRPIQDIKFPKLSHGEFRECCTAFNCFRNIEQKLELIKNQQTSNQTNKLIVFLENQINEVKVMVGSLIYESTEKDGEIKQYYKELSSIELFFRKFLRNNKIKLYDCSGNELLYAFLWLQCFLCEIYRQIISILRNNNLTISVSMMRKDMINNILTMFQFDDKNTDYHWVTNLEYEDSIIQFLPVKNNTQCVFSKNAILCGHKILSNDENFNIEKQFLTIIPYFVHFCLSLSIPHANPSYPLDGIVFCFPSSYGDTYEKISCFLNRFLEFISVYNTHARTIYSPEIVDKFWQFRFLAEEMFAIVFGECYNELSSRFMFGASQTFLLFQANRTFERYEMPSIPEHTGDRHNVRTTIRSSYRSKKRDYHRLETEKGVSAVGEQFVQATGFSQEDYKPWYIVAQDLKKLKD